MKPVISIYNPNCVLSVEYCLEVCSLIAESAGNIVFM